MRAIQSYGKEFKRLCFELSERVDLDSMPHLDDRQFFLDLFSQYLDSIDTYYQAKMAQVKAEKKEQFHVILGHAG